MGNQSKKRYYPKNNKSNGNKKVSNDVNVEKAADAKLPEMAKKENKKPAAKRSYRKPVKMTEKSIEKAVEVKTVVDPTFKNKETYVGDVKVDVVKKPIQKETASSVLETSFEVKEKSVEKEISRKLETVQVSETTNESNYGVHFIDNKPKTTTWGKVVSRIKKWLGK